MSIRYIHVRPGQNYNPDTHRLEGSPEPRSGMTIAYTTFNEGKTLKIGLALCHTNDPFDRKKGRAISSGRLTCDRPCRHTFWLPSAPDIPEDEQVLDFLHQQDKL